VNTSYAAKLRFQCTNNIAEYEALLLGLRKLKAMGVRREILKSNSQVIIGQVDKSSKAKKLNIRKVPRYGSKHGGFIRRVFSEKYPDAG
jgi:ribonuclease HI